MTIAIITTIFALTLAIAAMLYAIHWRNVADDLSEQLSDANLRIDELTEGDE